MNLILAYPQEAARTCKDCLTWVYDKEGSLVLDRQTKEPLRRKGSQRPACLSCPKCKGEKEPSPEVGKRADLSVKNQKTLQRYYEQVICSGVVKDAVTRRNFGIIQQQFDSYKMAIQRASLSIPRM